MHASGPFRPNAPWLRTKLAAALLLTFLQRAPAGRLIHSAAELIAATPAGALLKSAVATLASLGAVHSLAGATTLVASIPSPINATEGEQISPVAFTVSGTINLGSWRLAGNLPPGLRLTASQGGEALTGPGVLDATSAGDNDDDGYGTTPGGSANTMTTPILVGTPSQPGTYTFTLQAHQLGGLKGFTAGPFEYTIVVAASTQPPPAGRPSFTMQPAPQNATVGATVTLTAAASGSPAPAYQWHKNSSAISGATNATLTLSNIQLVDAGTYTVVASNSAGTVTSDPTTVAVSSPAANSPPTIARQPQGHTMAVGSTVVFSVDPAEPGLTYQWRKNGIALAGATGAALVLKGATAADAGAYSVAVANSAGMITSSVAALTVTPEPNFGRLINLSIRTSITANDPSFTLGTVVGGAGTSGAKPLLVRAVGPSLAAFGLTGAISDSRFNVLAGSTVVASNNDWNGDATLSAAFSQVGAFPFANSSSKDAAVFNPGLAARDYTVEVGGVDSATGEVLAEIYDATAAGSFDASTPRLINVSVRKEIEAGGSLTAGFVVGGNTARTVLVRAIGPGLAAFGVPDTLADPQLALFADTTKILENDNWGGDPQLTATGSAVGAFAIASAVSRDAMLLVTLAPGGYTAQVSGAAGTGGGAVLVEVYEVP